MATFADLGIPFRLFEVPTTEGCDFIGRATFRLYGVRERQCLELVICLALPAR